MKTNVSLNSIDTYHQIGALIASQDQLILSSMEPNKVYSRRQLSLMVGIENTAAGRSVNGLIASGQVAEVATIQCPITGRNVGGVALMLV